MTAVALIPVLRARSDPVLFRTYIIQYYIRDPRARRFADESCFSAETVEWNMFKNHESCERACKPFASGGESTTRARDGVRGGRCWVEREGVVRWSDRRGYDNGDYAGDDVPAAGLWMTATQSRTAIVHLCELKPWTILKTRNNSHTILDYLKDIYGFKNILFSIFWWVAWLNYINI